MCLSPVADCPAERTSSTVILLTTALSTKSANSVSKIKFHQFQDYCTERMYSLPPVTLHWKNLLVYKKKNTISWNKNKCFYKRQLSKTCQRHKDEAEWIVKSTLIWITSQGSRAKKTTSIDRLVWGLADFSFKGTPDWDFFWLRFWYLYYFFISYVKILRFYKKNFLIRP
jgi:hypothetical protein